MAEIKLINVSKSFGNTNVIQNLNLTIKDGSFTVLVGSSGCGKTTLLRMIAGIGPQTSGQILIDGKDVSLLPPAYRDIAMVFQNYAIYPTMTVRENIEFGLKNMKVPKEERDALVSEYSKIVGLEDYLDRKPSTLSGGQRQRVALARAMVKKPKAFLMDEPLSNLDAKLRVQMRSELIELHNRLQTTFVYVTHDQVEAMSMADDIVLLNQGKIQQMDSPEKMYNDPNSIFTARFIGTPPMNILKLGKTDLCIGFRPSHVILSSEKTGALYEFNGEIVTREMLGNETTYRISVGGTVITAVLLKNDLKVHEHVFLHFDEDSLYLFDADGNCIRNEGTTNIHSIIHEAGGIF